MPHPAACTSPTPSTPSTGSRPAASSPRSASSRRCASVTRSPSSPAGPSGDGAGRAAAVHHSALRPGDAGDGLRLRLAVARGCSSRCCAAPTCSTCSSPSGLGIRAAALARRLGTPVVAASHLLPENMSTTSASTRSGCPTGPGASSFPRCTVAPIISFPRPPSGSTSCAVTAYRARGHHLERHPAAVPPGAGRARGAPPRPVPRALRLAPREGEADRRDHRGGPSLAPRRAHSAGPLRPWSGGKPAPAALRDPARCRPSSAWSRKTTCRL